MKITGRYGIMVGILCLFALVAVLIFRPVPIRGWEYGELLVIYSTTESEWPFRKKEGGGEFTCTFATANWDDWPFRNEEGEPVHPEPGTSPILVRNKIGEVGWEEISKKVLHSSHMGTTTEYRYKRRR